MGEPGRQLGVRAWHTLACRSDAVAARGGSHAPTRSDYLRVLPPTDPDYSRVYGMRADTESLNAQFERAFDNRRLAAWGLHNQTVSVMMATLGPNV